MFIKKFLFSIGLTDLRCLPFESDLSVRPSDERSGPVVLAGLPGLAGSSLNPVTRKKTIIFDGGRSFGTCTEDRSEALDRHVLI